MKRYILFLLLSLCLTACQSTSRTSLPSWVTSPPSDEQHLYASGQGVTQYEAEQNALTNLASQIQVQVNEQINSRVIVDDQFQRQYFDQSSQLEVSAVSLAQAKTVQQAQSGPQWFVLKALSKQDLLRQQRQQLSSALVKLQRAMALRDAPSFSRWWRLQRLNMVARGAEGNLLVIDSMQGSQDPIAQQGKALLNTYQQQKQLSANAASIRIDDHTGITGLTAMMSTAVNKQGLALSQRGQSASILMRLDDQQSQIDREYYLTRTLHIELRYGEQVLAQTSISERAVGLGKVTQAGQVANQKIYKQLQNSPLLQQLFEPTLEQ